VKDGGRFLNQQQASQADSEGLRCQPKKRNRASYLILAEDVDRDGTIWLCLGLTGQGQSRVDLVQGRLGEV
jgi:hypothetical protein